MHFTQLWKLKTWIDIQKFTDLLSIDPQFKTKIKPEEFEQQLRLLLNKSKKQKEFARKFLWEKVIDYYINLYNEIYEELKWWTTKN